MARKPKDQDDDEEGSDAHGEAPMTVLRFKKRFGEPRVMSEDEVAQTARITAWVLWKRQMQKRFEAQTGDQKKPDRGDDG